MDSQSLLLTGYTQLVALPLLNPVDNIMHQATCAMGIANSHTHEKLTEVVAFSAIMYLAAKQLTSRQAAACLLSGAALTKLCPQPLQFFGQPVVDTTQSKDLLLMLTTVIALRTLYHSRLVSGAMLILTLHNALIHIVEREHMLSWEQLISIYDPQFFPQKNAANLRNYLGSSDFRRHAATARIYYNATQLKPKEALRVIYQREPTNITMNPLYDKERLQALLGHRYSVYNDPSAQTHDGSLFSDLPNTASVYAETYLWNPPGGNSTKEVACLSLPAPALDSTTQPHYSYYINEGQLDKSKYEQEMEFLFKTIAQVVRDKKDTAFNGTGIQRVVLSRFGQAAFLEAVSTDDRKKAHAVYKEKMADFLKTIKDLNLTVVMSEYKEPEEVWYTPTIVGNIIETSQTGDLIINPWDPHSAPGNGNDCDLSFDGAMGKSSGILLTQSPWVNKYLRRPKALVPVV